MSTEPEKPEWFKMTEADKAPLPRKRGLRAVALSLPLLVLGAGFVVAQSQNPPVVTANAAAASTPSSSASPSTSATSATTPTVSGTNVASIGTVPPIKFPTGKGNEGLEGNDN